MIIPLWAIFGFGSAAFSAVMMLLQERFKVDGYSQALWSKVCCLLVTAPLIPFFSLPTDPLFYIYLAASAVLWCIADVIFFSGVGKVGAGIVSRLKPGATVVSFVLWFIISPGLFFTYLENPVISFFIFLTLCGTGIFAYRLKKCEVSMSALRQIWFLLFSIVVGVLITKVVSLHDDSESGPLAYVFVQSLMMISLWSGYVVLKKPAKIPVFLGSWKNGLTIGFFNALGVLVSVAAFYHVDNPAYIPAIAALDSVMILFVYKLWGKKKDGDVLSGLGIVACAALLVILKTHIGT